MDFRSLRDDLERIFFFGRWMLKNSIYPIWIEVEADDESQGYGLRSQSQTDSEERQNNQLPKVPSSNLEKELVNTSRRFHSVPLFVPERSKSNSEDTVRSSLSSEHTSSRTNYRNRYSFFIHPRINIRKE